jgi:hypothetical protein
VLSVQRLTRPAGRAGKGRPCRRFGVVGDLLGVARILKETGEEGVASCEPGVLAPGDFGGYHPQLAARPHLLFSRSDSHDGGCLAPALHFSMR